MSRRDWVLDDFLPVLGMIVGSIYIWFKIIDLGE